MYGVHNLGEKNVNLGLGLIRAPPAGHEAAVLRELAKTISCIYEVTTTYQQEEEMRITQHTKKVCLRKWWKVMSRTVKRIMECQALMGLKSRLFHFV